MKKTLFFAFSAILIFSMTTRAATPVLDFLGNGYYVDLGTPAALQVPSGEPFTIEGWMLFNSLTSRDMLYSKNNDRLGGSYDYMLGFISGNMTAYDGSGWRYPTPQPAPIQTEQWIHVAFGYDGTNMNYYLDGEWIGVYSNWNFSNNSGNSVKLGGYSGSDGDINGHKSEVRVWNYARTPAQIHTNMHYRLTGAEEGMLGYWPMNEGEGEWVFDATTNQNAGTIVNAEWKIVDDLDFWHLSGDFKFALPFTLANIETGSDRFTNSNEVDLVEVSVPEGYDQFQITQIGEVSALGSWNSTSDIPSRVTFATPAQDTNVFLYAWFTNSAETVTLRRAESSIIYTTTPPVPNVHSNLARELLSGYFVRVYPEETDSESTGGETLGESMDIHYMSLNLLSGPDTDSTPEAPYVTVTNTGDYSLSLTVINEAGNVATSTAPCTLTVSPFSGAFSWTGLIDDDWFNPENWAPIGKPQAGDSVVIHEEANVLVTNSIPWLNDLTVSNATVTLKNWDTSLQGTTVTVGTGGNLSLPGPFTESEMSNRVWIVCTDFTLLDGGTIDVDGKGYGPAQGPGKGISGRRTGGGYGGRGGASHWWRDSITEGQTYGTPGGFPQPGSGGCESVLGGPGGGAVQIEAAGEITIHGVITADGLQGQPRRYTPPGGGSGGGIYLSCQSFSGSATGQIRARGGDGAVEKVSANGGRGGGGRIVIQYDSATPWPPVAIDAGRGVVGYDPSETSGDSYIGDWGTLWLSDTTVLDAVTDTIDAETFPLNQVSLYIDGLNEWHAQQLSISNRTFRFGNTNLLLKLDGALHVGTAGRLGVSHVEAGSVTLADGGRLVIRSTATNGVAEWGGRLDIDGDLHIGANSELRLLSDWYGGSPHVRVRNLILDENGELNAQGTGCIAAHGPGAGNVGGRRGGGGYGGAGGTGLYSDSDGQPYGSAIGPLFAGSGGCMIARGGHGGGLVHVEASGEIRLNGLINADGGLGGYNRDWGAGGGSGGGVFLVSRRITGSGSGVISARGGNGNGSNAGGGGGGRIALWTGVPRESFPRIWNQIQNGEANFTALVETNALPETLFGDISEVIQLAGGAPSGSSATSGQPGTFRWIAVKLGTLFILR